MGSVIKTDRSTPLGRLVVVLILLICASHFLRSFGPLFNGAPTYASYLGWFLLLGFWGLKNGFRSAPFVYFLGALVLFGSLVSSFSCELVLGVPWNAWHRPLFYAIAVVTVLALRSPINDRDLHIIALTVTMVGLIASVYAMIVQCDSLIASFLGENLRSASWNYVSFFLQRNVFAECLFLAVFGAWYLWQTEKRVRYVLLCIFYVWQVALTNSRAGMGAIALFLIVAFFLGSRHRSIPLAVLLFAIAVSLCMPDLLQKVIDSLTHFGGSTSSAQSRLDMWGAGLDRVSEGANWIFGYGVATSEIVTMDIDNVRSFHNVYVEALFEGGLVKLGIIIGVLVIAAKKVYSSTDGSFRATWTALIVAYAFHALFESGMMLLTSNYFSLITTLLVVAIPLCHETPASSKANRSVGMRAYLVE